MEKDLSRELADFIAESAFEKKCRDIVILNCKGLSDISDYLVIATADSDIQLFAVQNWINEELAKHKIKPYSNEAKTSIGWLVIDYVDVVVHLMREESRHHYNIEGMWADAEKIVFTGENEETKLTENHSVHIEQKRKSRKKKDMNESGD